MILFAQSCYKWAFNGGTKLEVKIEKRVIKTLNKYPERSREQIFKDIRKLENPYSAPEVECLHKPTQVYRMHVGRTYTIIFKIHKPQNIVQVLEVDTIERAHKRYGRYY
jgi:mRNA-degrading endonuclease RelE of RelBE toxin-antitoxin system